MLFDGLKLAEVLTADAEDVSLTPQGARLALERRGDPLELDARTAGPLVSYLGDRTEGPLLFGESPTRMPSRLTRFGADSYSSSSAPTPASARQSRPTPCGAAMSPTPSPVARPSSRSATNSDTAMCARRAATSPAALDHRYKS